MDTQGLAPTNTKKIRDFDRIYRIDRIGKRVDSV